MKSLEELEREKEERLDKQMKSFLKMSAVYGVIGFLLGTIGSLGNIYGKQLIATGHDAGTLILGAFLCSLEFIGFVVAPLIVLFCMIKFQILPLIFFDRNWEKEQEEIRKREEENKNKWIIFGWEEK